MRRRKPAAPANSATPALEYGIAAIGLVVLGISIWIAVPRNLDFPWTSIRLAPASALVHHSPLFCLPDKPRWIMVGYGPLYPVAYLPSVLARHPTAAVATATLLAHLYVLAPVALLCSFFGKIKRQELG